MTDLHFHILDVDARDETIESEDETSKHVSYHHDSDDDDIEFQSMKKHAPKSANTNSRAVIHLFGSTADGTPVRVDCKGFEPFFFVRCPNASQTREAMKAVQTYLSRHLKAGSDSVELRIVHRKLLYGYTANDMFPFVEIKVPSLALFREAKRLFLNGKQEPEVKKMHTLGFPFQGAPAVYEANLDPYLRFMHLRNLKPCDWCTVADGMSLADRSGGSLILEDCDWMDVGPCAVPPRPTAPFKIASWDIECYSASGRFPVAKEGDPVIQIGTVLTTLGSSATEKHIFTLGGCTEVPGAIVHAYSTEKALLKAWFAWMHHQQVDILIGYNIFGFDEQYVWHRMEALNLVYEESVQQMNRLADYGGEMELQEKRLSSSAMGDNFLHLWNTTGRLRIDLYHAIKRQYPMPSYKLDDTSRAFLNDAVKTVEDQGDSWVLTTKPEALMKQGAQKGRSMVLLGESGESLCEKCTIEAVGEGFLRFSAPMDVDTNEVRSWAIVKDDISPQEMFHLQKGSDSDRAIIAGYCVQDCQLVLDLFKKLDTFNNAASMANVCSVPVAHIFLRGQGIKIESLIFKYCYENNIAVEVLSSPGFGAPSGETESYEGAIVLDPSPGFYTVPVGVADFASLYPSTIISENISHDTLVCVTDYTLDGKKMGVTWGSQFAKYNDPSSTRFTDIEFDIWGVAQGDTRKNPEKVKTGIRVCRYAQDKKGAIPIIIAQLLDARKKTRAQIKTEKDPFRQALLDAQQNAYKITANSLYGQLGSSTFKIRLQNLAASVTAHGRKQILFAKKTIETFYGPDSGNPHCACKVVYGDTDSLFIAFHPRDPTTGTALVDKEALVKTIELTEEAGKLVTQALKAPHDFEFDKVYWPFLIFSKKRYVGHKYEENSEHYTQASMGIALKRRDYAPIVKKIYGGAIHILLTEKNVAKAAEFVKTACKELMEGNTSMRLLTITKSLRAEYADPSRIAHKALADRIAQRDPGNAPSAGDRIGYVYVQPPVGQQAPELQGDRIETPAYIQAKGLKPDFMYYIDHQISNPVCQVFGLLMEQVPGYTPQIWDENPDKEAKQRENLAYQLLFKDAMEVHHNTAKRSFLRMMGGATETASAPKASRVVRVQPIKAPVKQSKLDSFFVDSVKLTARQQVLKAKKKSEEKAGAMQVDA